MNTPQYIFIVGAPRSGTTWLHRIIAAHSEVAAIPQELTLFSAYLSVWFRNFDKETANIQNGKWEQGLPVLMEKRTLQEHARKLVDAVYGKVLERNPAATVVLDKHPNYANYMELIKELYPNAKFIHLIRDGRQVALSMMSVNKRVGHSAGDIKQAAEDWHRFLTNAQKTGNTFGNEHYFELRYEDLLEQGPELLAKVFSFCGFSVDAATVAEIYGRYQYSKGKLSSGDPHSIPGESDWPIRMSLKERYLFNQMAGYLLIELGYAKENWWVLDPLDKLKMSLAIPLVKLKRATVEFFRQLRRPVAQDLSRASND